VLKIFLDEQSCDFVENNWDFVNLLSFIYKLFSSQLEIIHVIQEPTEAN
jgi:hypothetical protein